MATSVTQYGVTWNFDADRPVGQYCNGDWWVLGPVTITSITPTSVNDGGRQKHGTMVNHGNRSFTGGVASANEYGSKQGFDSNAGSSQPRPYEATFNVDPGLTSTSLVLSEGSVVKSISNASVDATGRAALNTMAVLTVVLAAPALDAFRPPVASTSKASPWAESDLNYGILPSVPRVTGITSLVDATAGVQRMFQHGYTANLNSRNISPSENHPEYNREIAAKIEDAGIVLCLNHTTLEKRDLYVRMVQLGIDIYGRAVEGGIWHDNGGGSMGRKLPVVIAGLALGDSNILTTAARIDVFGCDRQIFTVAQEDVDRARYTADGRPRDAYTVGMIGTPEWGEKHVMQPNRDGANWGVSYRNVVFSTMTGASLAARWIDGGRVAWNNPTFFDYYDRVWLIEEPEIGTGVNDLSSSARALLEAYGPAYQPFNRAARPSITPAAGTYESGRTVSITTLTPAAEIYYSTDGSPPTTGSTLYSVPFAVPSSVTVRAIAVKAGFIDSEERGIEFVIDSSRPTPPSGVAVTPA